MKNFKNRSLTCISILTLFACSNQTFGMAHGARLFANAKAKAITLMTMIQPYAVTTAACYINSQTPMTPEKLSNFEFKHVSPENTFIPGFIRCRTKNEWENCGELKYELKGDYRKCDPNADIKSTDEFIVYIERIDVPEKYRRLGIATWMLELTERDCSAQKRIAELQLYSINPGATECYRRFGFEKIDNNASDYRCDMYKKNTLGKISN